MSKIIADSIHALTSKKFGRPVVKENFNAYRTHWFEAAEEIFTDFQQQSLTESAAYVRSLIDFSKEGLLRDRKEEVLKSLSGIVFDEVLERGSLKLTSRDLLDSLKNQITVADVNSYSFLNGWIATKIATKGVEHWVIHNKDGVEITKDNWQTGTGDGEFHFKSGWSAKREYGLIQTDTIPGVFAQGKWVLRNEKGDVVDMGKYQTDLFDQYPESNTRKLG